MRRPLAAIDRDFDGVVVSDIRMPRMDGLDLLARLRALDPDLSVILVTGHGDVPMAVKALHDGAADFLTKPFAADHLAASIRRALERRALVLENRRLHAAIATLENDDGLIGDSASMTALRETIRRIAAADVDVLVEGETGTGKELVARLIHREGPRRGRPFIAINCGALSEATAEIELFGHAADSVPQTRLSRTGQIAASDGGTLLLDEVDSMPLGLQAKLLRVLEEREVQPIGAERPDPAQPPRHRDDEERSRRGQRAGQLPPRPLLPAGDAAAASAAGARARRRSAAALRGVPRRGERDPGPRGDRARRRGPRPAASL
jgi:two-component system C4-dicarboxylate transport response regulator DctD